MDDSAPLMHEQWLRTFEAWRQELQKPISINVEQISGGGQPLTRVNDSNVTLTIGGTPATALLQAVSITVGWSGTLLAARMPALTGFVTTASGTVATTSASKLIVQGTTDANLTAAQFLGALGTGLVKNTTSTGVLSIGVAATDYVAPSAYASANGLTMATARLLGRTTAGTGAAQEISVAGTLSLSGGVLTGSAPTTIAITDDTTTNATMFPVWVTANTGSLPLKVTSTKLSFNPSTGVVAVVGLTASGSTVSGSPTLTVTQSSSPSVDTNLISSAATWNAGTVVSDRNLFRQNGVTTPTATVTESGADGVLTVSSSNENIALGGITMGDNPSGNPQCNIYGNSVFVTGNPTFNDTSGGGSGDSLSVFGYLASIVSAPVVVSSFGAERISYVGASYRVAVTQAALVIGTFGFQAITSGNIPNGTHTGANFNASGTATLNIGLDIGVSGGTANYGIELASPSAGANNYGLHITATAKNLLTGDLQLGAKVTKYNNLTTAGWGTPAIYGSGRSTAQSAAVASVAAYTVGAADGSFLVSANVNVTTSTTHSFSAQIDYTDETNTARTLTLNVSQLAGTLIIAITNLTGAGPYEGVPVQIRCKASTAITVKTTGTFTAVTYNVEGSIQQIS